MKSCKTCGKMFSGKACKPCHNAYMREWTKQNAEAVNARRRAARQADPERSKAYSAGYRERREELKKGWPSASPERIQARRVKYRELNRAQLAEWCRQWREKYPERARKHMQIRRSREEALGTGLSDGLIEKLLKLQRGKCACCGQPLGRKPHMDHIVPLALGGPHCDDNIQLLRPFCNLQKHAKHPVDFMQSKGFLL